MSALDVAALSAWLRAHDVGVEPPLSAAQIAGGFSNITFRLDDARGRAFALRRPPLGQHQNRAHDVLRECRIISALACTAVPVPPVVFSVDDPGVIGAPFYVMRWVEGAVIDTPRAADRALPTAALKVRAAEELVDGLAALHRIDIQSSPLQDLGPHEHYLQRQIERLRKTWARNQTRELSLVESLALRLLANKPPQRYTGIVHGDYRLGNTIVDTSGRLAAILDWELCAIGDLLVDIGLLANSWDEPHDSTPGIWMQEAPSRAPGFPDRAALVDRYARQSGFDLRDLDYYQAFGYWKLCVIAEGIKRRAQERAMADTQVDLDAVERRVHDRADLADRFLRRHESRR